MSLGNEPGANPYAPTVETQLPPEADVSRELATRGERFLGAFIDGLLMLPLAFGAGMVLGIGLIGAGIAPDGSMYQILLTVVSPLIGITIFLVINGYLLANQGQTVGKLVMKTRIVSDRTNTILPFGPLILKRYVPLWLVSSIPVVGGLFSLVNALAIFRENRKCIHDDIAGTKVIKLGT